MPLSYYDRYHILRGVSSTRHQILVRLILARSILLRPSGSQRIKWARSSFFSSLLRMSVLLEGAQATSHTHTSLLPKLWVESKPEQSGEPLEYERIVLNTSPLTVVQMDLSPIGGRFSPDCAGRRRCGGEDVESIGCCRR